MGEQGLGDKKKTKKNTFTTGYKGQEVMQIYDQQGSRHEEENTSGVSALFKRPDETQNRLLSAHHSGFNFWTCS